MCAIASRSPAPPCFPPVNRAEFEKVVDEYHKLRGWNADGIPTRDCLHDLDLDYVADELSRRGLYSTALIGRV